MKLINPFRKRIKPEVLFDYKWGGHTFKVLNPNTMNRERQMEFHNAFRQFKEWGLNPDIQLMFVEQLSKNRLNEKEYYGLEKIYKEMIKEEKRYREYIQTAAYTILLDDEKVDDDPNGPAYKKKLQLCGQSLKVEAFFFSSMDSIASRLTGSTADSPYWGTSETAKVVKRIETIFYKQIGETLYGQKI